MNPAGTQDARQALHGAQYRPLWTAARARLERNGIAISNRPVKVDVVGESRRAIAGLTGRSPAGSEPLAIRLDRLDDALRSGAAAIGLVELLEGIDGPLVDRRAARARRRATVSATWAVLARHPATRSHPGLGAWLDAQRASGTALRLAGSLDGLESLVCSGLDVVARLPVDDLPLAVFAARATGDAHALDRGTPLGSLVVGALEHLRNHDETVADSLPGNASRSWRDAWARVGVICDDVSPSVLVLNLTTTHAAPAPVSTALAAHRRAGLPLRLTLGQLRAEPLCVAEGSTVYCCENPSVVAHAATLLGAESAPLVCTDGQPNSAVDTLIGRLTTSGVTVRHHGDFDWGGIAIANTLVARHGVDLWQFSTSDYLAAAELGRVPLEAPTHPIAASWDTELVPSMQRTGHRVFEEQVLDALLADLGGLLSDRR